MESETACMLFNIDGLEINCSSKQLKLCIDLPGGSSKQLKLCIDLPGGSSKPLKLCIDLPGDSSKPERSIAEPMTQQ